MHTATNKPTEPDLVIDSDCSLVDSLLLFLITFNNSVETYDIGYLNNTKTTVLTYFTLSDVYKRQDVHT